MFPLANIEVIAEDQSLSEIVSAIFDAASARNWGALAIAVGAVLVVAVRTYLKKRAAKKIAAEQVVTGEKAVEAKPAPGVAGVVRIKRRGE